MGDPTGCPLARRRQAEVNSRKVAKRGLRPRNPASDPEPLTVCSAPLGRTATDARKVGDMQLVTELGFLSRIRAPPTPTVLFFLPTSPGVAPAPAWMKGARATAHPPQSLWSDCSQRANRRLCCGFFSDPTPSPFQPHPTHEHTLCPRDTLGGGVSSALSSPKPWPRGVGNAPSWWRPPVWECPGQERGDQRTRLRWESSVEEGITPQK